MATPPSDFARYCCELLDSVGPCVARRMFGGYGISTEGLTLAVVADLSDGERLWLKTNPDSQAAFEAEGGKRFEFHTKDGAVMSMNYYSAPDDAMESPALMAPWARLALQAALAARASKPPAKSRATAKTKPKASTAKAPKRPIR